MEVLGRIVIGAFVGALVNSTGWYIWAVLTISLQKGKLDLSGQWGGAFIFAAIGFLVGAVAGFTIGLIQPKIKNTMICVFIFVSICWMLLLPYYFSGPITKYYLETKDYQSIIIDFSWGLILTIITTLSFFVINRVVLSLKKDLM